MAITAESYFKALRDYVNTRDYEVFNIEGDHVVIKDKVFRPGEEKAKDQRVRLRISGEALVINLDKKNSKGNSVRLFDFLDDESKPWARRCDFVIFHLYCNQITAYCIEFKSGSFPEGLVDQMNAGTAWCRSLHSVIKHYTGKSKKIRILKFVLSCHQSPERFLDDQRKYLRRDHTIRHYQYKDIDGMTLVELENEHVETIG